MQILKLMAAAIGMLALAACTSSQSVNNPTAWGQIAAGVAAVVGETKIDPKIEQVSSKLASYCVEVQTAALAVDLFAPPKVQLAAQDARAVVRTFCASPPTSVATAITSLAAAYAAIEAARKGGGA
ncbi:hypothetical protein GCM10019059_07850 [Camelimonas fluminis]|uniref:Lipoprotein n=1 Tax=Camelimonas fluminis TaxID=1576911 RepID=A0ABV7UE89_9HYPH|nr:hypothetical protein [Camelimonas fluminis]GHE51074.1 hypothetical protein GCM10019059_07850 [Camelimonas fluminis]